MRWRTSVRPLGRVVVGVALMAGAGLPCSAAPPAACRDGGCEPHCPVRSGHFGYHATQWRRWPDAGPSPVRPRDTTVPAPPARSEVPGVDEESPRGAGPRREPDAAGARLERLVEEAEVVRLGDPARRQEFTARLVTAMLSEHDPRARRTVLSLAAAFDTPAAAAICAGAIDDPDPQVRLDACDACVARRDPGAATRLARRAHDDPDLGVRLRAVRALGEIGDPVAVADLVALLDDPDPAVRSRAVAALARSTGRNFGADADRWRAWAAGSRAASPRWSLGATLRGLF